ncbi:MULTISPECIES: hypothetical protein [Pseudanabaena]|uniref:hypothetical protein n=1 Tax=Pseudanabaena TaxID=1152 RepID=UPI002478EAB0|nr:MULTISPECIES: hypothetical protein [Pseudanabaena]MEA5489628.1 hypothetical protein [Pseudanabaena sp. CCNP1317]WGS75270.1 hypothetical protein OA858_25905 [Pseudanabaena galeata CCNP1313]
MTANSTLRDRLVKKLDDLEADKLNSVIDFVNFLLYQQQVNQNQSKPKIIQDRKILVEDLKQLLKETQAIHADNPITEEEIAEEIAAYRRGE